MNDSENEPNLSKNVLLDKILKEISNNKDSDTSSKIEEVIEDESSEEKIPKTLITKYGELESIEDEVLEKKLSEEEEEIPKKRSWLKIFFIFLFVILLFNLAYIVYMMKYKEEKVITEKKHESAIEVFNPSVKVEEKPVVIVAIEKMIDKPLEDAIEKAVKKLEKESVIPTPIQRPQESIPEIIVEDKIVAKEEILEEKLLVEVTLPREVETIGTKNPNDYIDVIEMRSVSSKVEVIERRRPLNAQDKKDLARQRAKKNLLEQMQN